MEGEGGVGGLFCKDRLPILELMNFLITCGLTEGKHLNSCGSAFVTAGVSGGAPAH